MSEPFSENVKQLHHNDNKLWDLIKDEAHRHTSKVAADCWLMTIRLVWS